MNELERVKKLANIKMAVLRVLESWEAEEVCKLTQTWSAFNPPPEIVERFSQELVSLLKEREQL